MIPIVWRKGMHSKDRKRMKKIEKNNKFYSRGVTNRKIQNAHKMAEYEKLAKERGVPVSRVIAEELTREAEW